MSPPAEDRTLNTRLAEIETIAVDRCADGTFEIHVGALSMRMEADEVVSLLATLGHAVMRHHALFGLVDGSGSADRRPEPARG